MAGCNPAIPSLPSVKILQTHPSGIILSTIILSKKSGSESRRYRIPADPLLCVNLRPSADKMMLLPIIIPVGERRSCGGTPPAARFKY